VGACWIPGIINATADPHRTRHGGITEQHGQAAAAMRARLRRMKSRTVGRLALATAAAP